MVLEGVMASQSPLLNSRWCCWAARAVVRAGPGIWEIVCRPGGVAGLFLSVAFRWSAASGLATLLGSGCRGVVGEAYSSLVGDGDVENGGRLLGCRGFSAGTCSTLEVVYYASMYCYVEGEAEDKAYWLPRLNT